VEGKFPAVLERTPYGKGGGSAAADIAPYFVSRGYVVVVQDVRGRYSSEGEWYTFKHESDDGYDTVEWVAALPYSNGKVGMWGGSYVGATQMLTAIAHPPHLAGICPVVTASNYHDGWTYQGGAFEQWFNQSWTSGLSQDTVNRMVEKNTNAVVGAWKLPLTSYPLFNFSDPAAAPISTNAVAPYFLDWLAHPSYDDYWKPLAIEERYADINVPILHIAAWYDIFQGGSLRNYIGIKAHGGSDAALRGQHLFVTIGGHAGGGRKIGDIDFGPAAAEFNENEITLKWYQYLFQGAQNEFAGKPVKMFTPSSSAFPPSQRTISEMDAMKRPWFCIVGGVGIRCARSPIMKYTRSFATGARKGKSLSVRSGKSVRNAIGFTTAPDRLWSPSPGAFSRTAI